MVTKEEIPKHTQIITKDLESIIAAHYCKHCTKPIRCDECYTETKVNGRNV